MNTKVVPVEPLYIISADKGKLTVMSVTDALAGTRIPAAPDRNEQILAAQDRHSLPSSPSDRWKGPYVQPNTSGSIADVPKPAPSKESKLPLSAEEILGLRNSCDPENSDLASVRLDIFFNLLDQALAAIELKEENSELREALSMRNQREHELIRENAELKHVASRLREIVCRRVGSEGALIPRLSDEELTWMDEYTELKQGLK